MSPTISRKAPAGSVTVSRVSSTGGPMPKWSLAVFAHNEAGRIRAALETIVSAAGSHDIEVVVLANGCTDATIDEVRACAKVLENLSLVEIDFADKANAWNLYVHNVITPERAREVEVYFFMDGDVTLEAGALPLLAASLEEHPSAFAAGGMPATGRDRDAWRERMVKNGTLAGNLYALRPGFVDRVRQDLILMPVGLIGEDLFLSWLIANWPSGSDEGPSCVFCANAEFSFRSLSPTRPADWRTYIRRKWRYTWRALQLEMLMHVIRKGGMAAMPADVTELYESAPLPSRLKWVGLDSPMRFLAVQQIRSFRKG